KTLQEKISEGEKSFQEQQSQLDKLSTKVNAERIERKESKSFSEVLGEALTEATDNIAKFERKEIKGFTLDIKAVGDVTTSNVTGGSRYGQVWPQASALIRAVKFT